MKNRHYQCEQRSEDNERIRKREKKTHLIQIISTKLVLYLWIYGVKKAQENNWKHLNTDKSTDISIKKMKTCN